MRLRVTPSSANGHRSDGLERIRIVYRDGTQRVVDQPEPVYSLSSASNLEWETGSYRYGYTSLVTPHSSVESRPRLAPGPPGVDPARARQLRPFPLPDRAPVGHGDRRHPGPDFHCGPEGTTPRDGSAPCVLYGYGAYEFNSDPSFSPARLNLLERGVSFAIAHVRGGGELGRHWYEEGRMAHKRNTFTDFVAAAEHLVATGGRAPTAWSPGAPAPGVCSWGQWPTCGLICGEAIVAEVPFVDVVTTMSDTDASR